MGIYWTDAPGKTAFFIRGGFLRLVLVNAAPLRCFSGKGTENKTRLRLGRIIFCTGLLVLGGINSYTARNKRMEKVIFPGADCWPVPIVGQANISIG